MDDCPLSVDVMIVVFQNLAYEERLCLSSTCRLLREQLFWSAEMMMFLITTEEMLKHVQEFDFFVNYCNGFFVKRKFNKKIYREMVKARYAPGSLTPMLGLWEIPKEELQLVSEFDFREDKYEVYKKFDLNSLSNEKDHELIVTLGLAAAHYDDLEYVLKVCEIVGMDNFKYQLKKKVRYLGNAKAYRVFEAFEDCLEVDFFFKGLCEVGSLELVKKVIDKVSQSMLERVVGLLALEEELQRFLISNKSGKVNSQTQQLGGSNTS